jgi:hypothetical protein
MRRAENVALITLAKTIISTIKGITVVSMAKIVGRWDKALSP